MACSLTIDHAMPVQRTTLGSVNLLKKKCNLFYIRNQCVLHSKHLPPRL